MYTSIEFASSSITILLSLLSFSAPSLAQNINQGGDRSFQVHRQRLDNYWIPSPNRNSQHVLNLKGNGNGNPISAAYAKSLRQGSQVNGTYGYEEVDANELRTLHQCPLTQSSRTDAASQALLSRLKS